MRLGPEAGGLTVFGIHTIRFPHSLAQFRQVTEIAKVIEQIQGETRMTVEGMQGITPRVAGGLERAELFAATDW